MSSSFRRITAEALASGMLVSASMLALASGAIIGGAGLDTMAIGLVVGLTMMAMMAIFMYRGGVHTNPAITLGALVSGRVDIRDAIERIVAQFAGAAIAAGALLALFGTTAMTSAVPSLGVGVGTAMLIEGVATFALVLLWLRTVDRGEIGALLVGLGMTLGVILTLGITGGMLNPIRAFGPELAVGDWVNMSVWLIGPLLGGALAAAVDRYALGEATETVTD